MPVREQGRHRDADGGGRRGDGRRMVRVARRGASIWVVFGLTNALRRRGRSSPAACRLTPRVARADAALAGLGAGLALYLGTVAFVTFVRRWPAFAEHVADLYGRGAGLSLPVALVLAVGLAPGRGAVLARAVPAAPGADLQPGHRGRRHLGRLRGGERCRPEPSHRRRGRGRGRRVDRPGRVDRGVLAALLPCPVDGADARLSPPPGGARPPGGAGRRVRPRDMPREARRLLEDGEFCYVAAATPPGRISRRWSTRSTAASLWLTTARSSAKARAWKADPRVAGMVRVGDLALTFRGTVKTYDALTRSRGHRRRSRARGWEGRRRSSR